MKTLPISAPRMNGVSLVKRIELLGRFPSNTYKTRIKNTKNKIVARQNTAPGSCLSLCNILSADFVQERFCLFYTYYSVQEILSEGIMAGRGCPFPICPENLTEIHMYFHTYKMTILPYLAMVKNLLTASWIQVLILCDLICQVTLRSSEMGYR